MLLYFSLSLFVSATLLFLVQPMIGKMILPQLGGTPAVWNTCMVFFQGVLLIGYGYTHLVTTTQSTKRQLIIQGCLLFLPFLVLPFSLGDWTPPTDSNPIFMLLLKLTIMVGLPFFLVSTTAPLLQKWFFHTGHPAAKDPYFLYGASNFGSMLGLALYPTVVEPWLMVTAPEDDPTWKTQVHLWTAGYAVFVAMVIGCAYVVWQSIAGKVTPAEEPAPAPAPAPTPAPAAATAITAAPAKRRGARMATTAPTAKTPTPTTASSTVAPPTGPPEGAGFFEKFLFWWWGASQYGTEARAILRNVTSDGSFIPQDNVTPARRLRWVGLAAAASSLMLGVTTYITTDIAAVAFFWIIPLALYLLTFILVFARWPAVWTETPHTIVMFLQPCLLLLLVLKMIANISIPSTSDLYRWDTVLTFFLHLGAFFATTLMCHGELAKDRPSTKYLTEFYFWMSLGGVLGGLFNALFAPIFFQYGIWEYMVAMVVACLMRSCLVDQPKTLIPGDTNSEETTPVGVALDFAVPFLVGAACYGALLWREHYPTPAFFILGKTYLLAALVVLTLALSLRPVRFGLSVAMLFIAVGAFDRTYYEAYIYEGRGFFGLLRVRESGDRAGVRDPEKRWVTVQFPRMDDGKKPHIEQRVYRTLIHGGINHGREIVHIRYMDQFGDMLPEDPQQSLRKRREPITYFHERNGVAELFHKLCWPNSPPPTHVVNMTGVADARLPAAMVGLGATDFSTLATLANTQSEPSFAVLGLGTGILASYAKPYQHVDIYEIDPLVKNLSIVPGYVPPWDKGRAQMSNVLPDPTFYFVHDAQERFANIDVKLGDGRLVLKQAAPEMFYHIIALDAFSSDAIPVHLLTKEAVELYLSKLADGGVLIFNTTNRYVRIEGPLAKIAEELDCDCLYCPDYTYDATDHPDRFSADWVVLQPKLKAIGARYKNAKDGAGLVLRSLNPGGPADRAGLKEGDTLLELDGEPLKANARLGELLSEHKLGASVTFLVQPKGTDRKDKVQLTLPTTYTNGGLPIAERLEKDRKRLAWNGQLVVNDDGTPTVDSRWRAVTPMKGRVWSDSYSNLLNSEVMPWLAPWKK